ncbi:MAG TPA: NAD(P)H-binding protein [Rhodopila sp.]|nr:NAD(P)H-binding protein [Rhodopila sp.]
MTAIVHVVGASGRSGQALIHALLADAIQVVPVVRNPTKWQASGIALPARQADLRRPETMAAALADAHTVVSCAHARYASTILQAAPAAGQFVFLGSTRKFTRWPDAHGNGVLAGEAALMASGRPGVMLHPTMIYGAQGEDNVQRLAALLRRTPVLPLPGGGKFLVQPIHQSDVTRAIQAALSHAWTAPHTLIIAGPTALPYADFVRAVAIAAGLRRPWLLPFPAGPLIAATRLTRHVSALPRIEPAEVRRLLEDKAFDIREMRTRLGINPIPLSQGLALTFGSEHTR